MGVGVETGEEEEKEEMTQKLTRVPQKPSHHLLPGLANKQKVGLHSCVYSPRPPALRFTRQVLLCFVAVFL